jgi:hypothetical protein
MIQVVATGQKAYFQTSYLGWLEADDRRRASPAASPRAGSWE